MHFDPLQFAPEYLRSLASRIESLMQGKSKKGPPGDGEEIDDSFDKDWLRDIMPGGETDTEKAAPPPPWNKVLPKYLGNPFLNPEPMIFKKRYTYDREIGDRPIMTDAEEYSDIALASVTDFALDDLDERLLRKGFDIPMYQTELPPEGSKGKPYTFFMCDVSGSMAGQHAQHACALAHAAADKVFKEDGVFVWLPYGNDRKDAVEFHSLQPFIDFLKRVNFDCGTTYIGANLKALADSIAFRVPYKHKKGAYTIPADCDKSRSKVFVVHDGTDEVDGSMHIRVPVFSIILGQHHAELERISKRTRGKYWNISQA